MRASRRLLPKHSPSLRPGDFVPYLLARTPLRRRGLTLQEVWSAQLPDRALLGARAGREALWRFLEAASPAPGSEVLVAAYNYYVVVRILIQWGLAPVFVDIERDTLGMDPEDLRRKISPASSLVVLTHMFGIPANVNAIVAVCRQAGLPLFEDCAHGVGTIAGEQHVGSFGDGALFSFGPFKSVTAFGGGMLALAPALRHRLDQPAAPKEGPMARWGTFLRMLLALQLSVPVLYRFTLHPLSRLARFLADRGFTPLQDLIAPPKDRGSYRFSPGAHPSFREFMPRMLKRQLARQEQEIQRRRTVIAAVKQAIASQPEAQPLREDRYGRANGSYFGLYVPDPEGFAAHMLRHGIEVNPHEFYDCAGLQQFRAFASHCPNAEHACNHLARLPSYPTLREGDVQRMIDAIRSYFAPQPGPPPHPAPITRASSPAA